MSMYETRDSEYLELEDGELEQEGASGEWESDEWENQEWESDEWENQEWEGAGYQADQELVSELLEVTSEEELEQFLGKLFRRTAKAVGGAIRTPVGRALADGLKKVARRALPAVGGALGNLVLPGVGGALGAQAGSMAGKMFELELEGMDEQEAEFEVGRRFVQLATSAARQAARAPGSAPARAVAKAALVTAARRHAPGLLRGAAGRRGRPQQRRRPGPRRPRRRAGRTMSGSWTDDGPDGGCTCGAEPLAYADADADTDTAEPPDGSSGELGRPQSGRWVRRGRKILIMGA